MERPLLGQPLGDAQAIDAVHPVEAFGDGTGLVGLDGADEMPTQLQIREAVHFGKGFLQIIFAEIRDAGGGGEADSFGSLRLGNCDQCDRTGVSPRGIGCTTYARPDVVHMKRQILRTN